MPQVIITAYEAEHDVLPAVCMTCGGPATERLDRKVHQIDDPGRWYGLYGLGVMVSIFFLPPLFPLFLRRARVARVRVPYCGPDRTRAVRHDRLALRICIPIWLVVALALDTFLVARLLSARPYERILVAGVAGVGCVLFALGDSLIGWRQRRRRAGKPPGFQLPNAHPAFVAALTEERARDRVSNPDRRDGYGDIRDDFDDQAG